jgi:hypothetical protein
MLSVTYAECHLCRVSLMLSVTHKPFYAECHYVECRYAERHGAVYLAGFGINSSNIFIKKNTFSNNDLLQRVSFVSFCFMFILTNKARMFMKNKHRDRTRASPLFSAFEHVKSLLIMYGQQH